MDRARSKSPVYDRQRSVANASGGPASPMLSPLHHHARLGAASLSTSRRTQNYAAKAAAQRLAQVMAHQSKDKEEEDDLSLEYNSLGATGGIGLAPGRPMRSRSTALGRNAPEQPPFDRYTSAGRSSLALNSVEQPSFARSSSSAARPSLPFTPAEQPRSTSVGRSSLALNHVEQPSFARSSSAARPSLSFTPAEQPPSDRSTSACRSSLVLNSVEQPSSALSTSAGRSSLPFNSVEQSPSPHSTSSVRSPLPLSSVEQPLSARSSPTGRPSLAIKTVGKIPSSVPISLKPLSSMPPSETPNRRDKRLSVDTGNMSIRETGIHRSTSALQDEIDMLQEENESILEKLRLAMERYEEAEARARLLEKQVATIGEGVSLEARLLSRKEAALQQREVHTIACPMPISMQDSAS
ncbi:PREDICTED: coiled-coil domain-containing protein SCD2-like [Nelumbo nucifera]|uniref:Coiled-coil domain-containing protein SCD2-like n=1 Tax=Nelumbo nucifera TaxID=4432 RepID=A0A1U7Z3R5_NELNU|nr:PREDICTED: coiled-coil domain-containing protein SCD2-like [Nelumbo nucifera]